MPQLHPHPIRAPAAGIIADSDIPLYVWCKAGRCPPNLGAGACACERNFIEHTRQNWGIVGGGACIAERGCDCGGAMSRGQGEGCDATYVDYFQISRRLDECKSWAGQTELAGRRALRLTLSSSATLLKLRRLHCLSPEVLQQQHLASAVAQRIAFRAESARLVAVLGARTDASERRPSMHGDTSQTRSGLRLVLSVFVSPCASSGRPEHSVV
eukprot:4355297-Prymnesium_polylepis.3